MIMKNMKRNLIMYIVVILIVMVLVICIKVFKKIDYYEFIDKKCGFEISNNLIFQEGEVSSKQSFRLIYEVKDGCENNLRTTLENNIRMKAEKNSLKPNFLNKKYVDFYNNGNIIDIYHTTISGSDKSCISVFLNLIEQDGKLYLFVFTL